jgi:hypothetical protein
MESLKMHIYADNSQLKLTIIAILIALTLTTVEIISIYMVSAEGFIKQRSIQDLINRNDSLSAYLQGNLEFSDCDIVYDNIKGSMNFTNCIVKN